MRRSLFALALLAACASTPDAPGAEAGPPPRRPEAPATASLWNQDPQSLFGNRRAREVGDILTLIVEIDEEAEIGDQTQRGRSAERGFGVGALFGLPQWAGGRLPGGAGIEEAVDVGSSSQVSGGGSLRREDRVTLRLAVRVTERLPNGDLLTLIVEIDEEAEIGDQTQRGRSAERGFGVGALFGLPQWAGGRLPGGAGIEEAVDVGSSSQVSGGGSLRREDRVTLRLAVRVTERLPNGDLRVEGRQSVRVNREERRLHASGIVRPEDISRANTVTHDEMAEAEIGYVGRGAIGRAGRPRLGERLLDAVTPF